MAQERIILVTLIVAPDGVHRLLTTYPGARWGGTGARDSVTVQLGGSGGVLLAALQLACSVVAPRNAAYSSPSLSLLHNHQVSRL